MQVDLSDADIELLTEILSGVISDLSPEIADTDNPTYRRELKERRARIRELLVRVGAPEAAQDPLTLRSTGTSPLLG